MNPLSLLSSRVPRYEPPRPGATDAGPTDVQAQSGAPPGTVAGAAKKEAPRPGQAGPPPEGSPTPNQLRGAQTGEQKSLGPEPDPAANVPGGIGSDAFNIIHAAPPVTVAPPPPGNGGGTGNKGEDQPAPGPTPPIIAHTLIEEARVAVAAATPVAASPRPKPAMDVPMPVLKGGAVGPVPKPVVTSDQGLEFPGIVPQPNSGGGVETPGIVPRPTSQSGIPVTDSGEEQSIGIVPRPNNGGGTPQPFVEGLEHPGIVPKPSSGGETPQPAADPILHLGVVPRLFSGVEVPRPVTGSDEAPAPGIVPRLTSGLEVPRPHGTGQTLMADEALAKIVSIHVDAALGIASDHVGTPVRAMGKPQRASDVPAPVKTGEAKPQPVMTPRPKSEVEFMLEPKPTSERPATDSVAAAKGSDQDGPLPRIDTVLGRPVTSSGEALLRETAYTDEFGEIVDLDVTSTDVKPVTSAAHAAKSQDVDRAQPLPEPDAKEVVRQLADRIENMVASRRSGQVVIKLEPYDLGTLTLTVKAFGSRVDAEVTASNDTVRQSLVQHRSDLVQNVESRGLSLNSFHVGQEQSNGQTFAGYQDAHAEALRTAATARANADVRPASTASPTFSSNVLTAIDTVA